MRPFLRFFRWYCHPKLRDSIEGDLMELHQERLLKSGKRIADLRFIADVILLFRPGIIRPAEGHQNLNQYGMLKNYFTIGWRTLLRNKGYSAINIGGLAAGMAVTILIGMWIFDELSFNRSFKNYDRIGHVMVHNGEGTYPSNPIPLEAELRRNYSNEIERISLATWQQEYSITNGDKKFLEYGAFMQPDAAEIFTFEMIYGTRAALAEPNTIMVSETLSRKLFGTDDPIGRIVRIKNQVDVRVGAVYKDFRPNTNLFNLQFIGSWDFLLSWVTWIKDEQDRWDNNSNKVYVLLKPGISFDEFSAKIKDVKKAHLNEERLKSNPELFVHPMSRWHLYSKFLNRQIVNSEELQFVWLYGIIGGFVLILACINFVNLSTARSDKRSKEVGIRKTMGSLRPQLIFQFLSESFITVTIAAACSIIIVLLVLPFFNDVAAKRIEFPWSMPLFWLALIAFVFVAGLMAGSYPALYLSSFKPVKVLRSRMNPLPRRVLIVLQFTISLALIVGTIVVYQQIEFARNRPVGYTREGLISVSMITPELNEHYDAIRNELLQSNGAENVASSYSPVTAVWSSNSGITWKGMPDGMQTNFALNWVTQPYGKTVGWQFIEGRDFSNDIKSDSTAIVINRAAMKYMGMQDPIGQELTHHDKVSHIVGVVEDMVMGSPYQPSMPTIFRFANRNIMTITIRLNSSLSASEAIDRISPVFQKYNPSVPFTFKFVDDEYNNKFASEVRVGKLAMVFSALAILISLLGLFGMSAFVAEQRTKEIGIRKVVGASVPNLWAMLIRNFVTLVTVACVIAFPLAYYLLSNWLTKFEYRIDVSLWIFPAVIACALLVTIATVSYQALRAALLNPVESLKSE